MTMRAETRDKYLNELITYEELDEARSELYSGKILNVFNYRTERIEHAQITEFYTNVIMCDNGCSYTIGEYAAYRRNKNRPVGAHWSSTGKIKNVVALWKL